MPAEYDVFVSHAWADGDRPREIADALKAVGLKVWFDETEIADFESITRAVDQGLARSKALLAYYSKSYPTRRACQWELTAAFIAAQREGDPQRRILVVNAESGSGHIQPIELRDAKYRAAPGDASALKSLAESVRGHLNGLTGALGDLHPLKPPTWFGFTPARSASFVGRLVEMWQIHSLLHASDVALISGAPSAGSAAQVRGLGGIGKSLLAEEYALRFGPAYPGGIFWLSAHGNDDSKAGMGPEGREQERDRQLRSFAGALGATLPEKSSTDQVSMALGRAIETRGEAALWVVDDLPSGLDSLALRQWFAPHPLARTLITTRSREHGRLGGVLDLGVLPEEDAYALLTSQRTPHGPAEEEAARGLASDLGGHALALDVTGAALASFGGTEPFRNFRAQLARKDQDALALAEQLADALPNGHEASIAQTFLRSIRNLGPEAQDFLRLASVLAVVPISASLVAAVFAKADNLTESEAEWRQARASKGATGASLAEAAGELGDARVVHTLVSRVVRFRDPLPERARALRAAAVETLAPDMSKSAIDIRRHKDVEMEIVHARELTSTVSTIEEANLLGGVARYDLERAAYHSAEILYRSQVEFRRRVLGPEHPDTLASMNNLAETLGAQGDLAGARKLQEEALAVRRRVLGPEHPDTLTSMNDLAWTLGAQGDLAGARKLQKEALAVTRRVLGPEHTTTSGSAWNLFSTLRQLGEEGAAAKVLEEDLRWLLDRDPNSLGADQRKIREYIAQTTSAGQAQRKRASW